MRLPFNRALIWLFLEGKTREEVLAQLEEISLPKPELSDFEEIETQARNMPLPPSTRRRIAKKQFDNLDLVLMERLGYAEIYCQHVANFVSYPMVQLRWEEISRLLRNPVLRIGIDVGLLCRYSFEELTQILPSVFHENFTEDAIALYCKYFFDHENMSRTAWREYMKLLVDIPYAFLRYHAALTKPRDEALYLAGLPTRTNFTDFLKTVMQTAAYKFQLYSRHQTPQSDAHARHWAKVGFDAGVRYEKFSAADITDFGKAIQTEFEYEEAQIETIQPDLLSAIKPPEKLENKTENLPSPNLKQREREV